MSIHNFSSLSKHHHLTGFTFNQSSAINNRKVSQVARISPHRPFIFSDVIMYVEYCQFTFPTILVFIYEFTYFCLRQYFLSRRHHSSRWRHPPLPVPVTNVLFHSKMAVLQSAKNLEFENWDAQTPVCPSPILAQRELAISSVGATLTTYHI